jgi:hypothetical protein
MDTAQITIDAPAEDIYDLVADISNMGRWSPETYKTAWLDGAEGAEPGARFKGWNRVKVLGVPGQWSTTAVVREAHRGQVFSFEVPFSGTRWTYRFDPSADGNGCDVTETRELVDRPLPSRIITATTGWIRTGQIVQGMQTTLERLKVAAEA